MPGVVNRVTSGVDWRGTVSNDGIANCTTFRSNATVGWETYNGSSTSPNLTYITGLGNEDRVPGAIFDATASLMLLKSYQPGSSWSLKLYDGSQVADVDGLLPANNLGDYTPTTDINITPSLKINGQRRLWLTAHYYGSGAYHYPVRIEKRAGGTGAARWHNPPSMAEGAWKLNARGEAITPSKYDAQTQTAIHSKIWRNGTYTDLNTLTSKPETVTITHAVDLASNGIILATASENGVSKTGLLLPVDLDIIKPGTETEDIPENLEDWTPTKKIGGWVVSLNWDDDDGDGGDSGHGNVTFTNDFDDEDGTQKEDDLIQLKIHPIPLKIAKSRIKFDSVFFRIWKSKDRTEEVESEVTELNITMDEELILYLEGKKITEAEDPKNVELHINIGEQEAFQKTDTVSLHVATPIIFTGGVSQKGRAIRARDLHGQLMSDNKNHMGADRIDKRKNTFAVKGKNSKGKLLYYTIDIFHVDAKSGRLPAPGRGVDFDKELKMAMGVEGAHVIYSGHANYGLGPNFTMNGTTSVDDYMNLSSHGMAAPGLRAVPLGENPDNPDAGDIKHVFKDLEHGGPNFALREGDVVQVPENKPVSLTGGLRWPGFPDTMQKKEVHQDKHPYHAKTDGELDRNWYTVAKSTGDKPVLKYASCFMAACNSGRHFGMDLDRQTYFYSNHDCYTLLGKNAAPLNDDEIFEFSFVATYYVKMLTDGKTFSEIRDFLNGNQYYFVEDGEEDKGPPQKNMWSIK